MGSDDRREIFRDPTIPMVTPLKCIFVTKDGEKHTLKIINYHYRGACFHSDLSEDVLRHKKSKILFFIGNREIREKITWRIVWDSIEENGMFGVEFIGLTSDLLERSERFAVHRFNQPVLHCKDPLDPNRNVYFKVKNLSRSGLLLSTSLSNKHIFPGMDLEKALLTIPGMGQVTLDLYVENCRPTKKDSVDYGVSIRNPEAEYVSLAGRYASSLSNLSDAGDRLESIEKANLLSTKLSEHLTIRLVSNDKDYEKVLRLRFQAHKKAGKVREGFSHKDMGQGLETEGFLLAAFLGGQLIASCEFRIGQYHSLNLSKKLKLEEIKEIDLKNVSEVNKLVVHPKAKGTDVVLGIFQKIHAMATLNGSPDGLILSEKKLIPLYERLGFHKLDYFVEHSEVEGLQLQLMLIKGKTYSSSEGMNPYAWSVAFELSHHFFNKIGVQEKVSFNIKQKLVKTFTQIYFSHFKKNKKKKTKNEQSKASTHPEKYASRDISNPRWTKQHINATVMLPYILESDKLIGTKKTDEILFKYSLGRSYFKKVSNWISIEFFDSFIFDFAKEGDPYQLNRDAAYRATTKEILGANYFLMKHFFSPKLAFKAFEKYFPKFNKTRSYKVVETGFNFCRIKITNPYQDLIPKHHATGEHWKALLDAYVRVLTGKPAKVTVLKSTFEGDSHCEYIVKWRSSITKNPWLPLAAGLLLYLPAHNYFISPLINETSIQTLLLILFCFTLVGLIVTRIRSSEKYNDIIESMHELETSADTKYRELQRSKSIVEKSYQESRLLDSINRTIQTTDDLNSILQIALENVCTHFGFKRAFIMILDDDQKVLRTASVFGATETVSDLWRFKVDISSQRDNPALLSSVYHTSQSVIINDVKNHLFHLNETSQYLVKKLQVDAFAMVSIPSEVTNWGVVLADKGSTGQSISRRELVSLKRISQSIGLALDKKSKLDAEITARKVFQKFVPAWLVDETLKNKEPELGGKAKEAICLFMDIRNFTSISADLPPEVLVDLLNEIFHSLQEAVSKHGGVIDKFLGDGALVTWGVFPASPLDPHKVLKAINDFSFSLEKLNDKLKPRGIPHIEAGFGIERGTVIAGNIGSSDRMEFTVIGSTVNIASRLEQLTKRFSSNIVISDNVFDFKEIGKDWDIHKEIRIRGIDEPKTIASFKNKKRTA